MSKDIRAIVENQLQKNVENIKHRLVTKLTEEFREELVKIAANTAINVQDLYDVETMDNRLSVVIRVEA